MGVMIGNQAITGTNSFVNRDIPAGAKAFGCPALARRASSAFAVEQAISSACEAPSYPHR